MRPSHAVRAGITFSLVAWGHATSALAQEGQWITRTQRVSVASLDSTFPAVPFDRWLARLRALPGSTTRWEVNDCGEGGDGRAAPTCVEAILDLAPDTTAHASVIVGALDGTPGTPAIWMLYVAARDSIVKFERLSEWAAYVRRRVPAPRPCALRVHETAASRNLPHAFYDQGVESLRALYPAHRMLVGRRTGRLGQVEYSLIAYRPEPAADSVHIQSVAVAAGRAWDIDAACPVDSLARGLVAALEAIAALPDTTASFRTEEP